jgi:transposase-like protein
VAHCREELLSKLRNIAQAETEDEYQERVNVLKKSAVSKENKKLQKWFDNYWLAEKKVGIFKVIYYYLLKTMSSL